MKRKLTAAWMGNIVPVTDVNLTGACPNLKITRTGRKIFMFAFFLAACLLLPSRVTAVDYPSLWQKELGKDTVFLLLPDPSGKSIMTDATGKYKVAVTGGEVVPDPEFGSCVRLGDGDKNLIKVKDNGNADFSPPEQPGR